MNQDMKQTFGRGRKLAILFNVIVMVVLALGIAGVGTYLFGFTDFRHRVDLTDAGTYTLQVQTERLLDDLSGDVEVITVFERRTWWWDQDQVWIKAMDYVVDLLQEYRVRGKGRLMVENLNPQLDAERIRDLYHEYSLSEYNTVIIRSGDNTRILGLNTDLAEFDLGAPQPVVRPTRLLAYTAEEALSSAIFEVTQAESAKIYALTGHDELSLNSTGDLGGALLAVTLAADNMDVIPISLVASGKVPEDADAVLILGPKQPFLSEEKVALDAYLRRGGRLLIAIDPLGDRSLDSSVLSELGVEIERNIVCHTQSGTLKAASATEMWVGGGAPGTYGVHDIVGVMNRDGDVMRVVRSGAVISKEGTETTFTSLILSHPDAFGDIAENDQVPGNYIQDPRFEEQRQRILAAAIEPGGPYQGSKVVLVPAVPWVTNFLLQRSPGNEKFFRRAVAWLVGKEQAIRLPPRRPRANVADLRPGEEDEILLYSAGYLPFGALLLALLVWYARRR